MENKPLAEKYLKSIALIEQGKLTYKEIAKICGINLDNFYGLVEGTATNLGKINDKFTDALSEMNKRRDKEIRTLAKNCRKKTLYLIDDYLTKHKGVGKKDRSLVSSLTSIANCLSKVTPNVEIGSFSYTRGLSAEDLVNEFKRLKAVASDRIQRRGVSGLSTGGTGKVDLAAGAGDTTSEEPENPILPTESET